MKIYKCDTLVFTSGQCVEYFSEFNDQFCNVYLWLFHSVEHTRVQWSLPETKFKSKN